eukprot:g2466.t1
MGKPLPQNCHRPQHWCYLSCENRCREALKEEGDLEKAVVWLKKRGLRSMEKRAADSDEALLSLGLAEAGAIVELRAETDFVTRSEVFQQTLRHLAHMMAASPDAAKDQALDMTIPDGPERPAPEARYPRTILIARVLLSHMRQLRAGATLSEALLELGSVLGEKLVLGNVPALADCQVSYVHPKSADSMRGTGRMAGLVSVRSPDSHSSADGFRAMASRLAHRKMNNATNRDRQMFKGFLGWCPTALAFKDHALRVARGLPEGAHAAAAGTHDGATCGTEHGGGAERCGEGGKHP